MSQLDVPGQDFVRDENSVDGASLLLRQGVLGTQPLTSPTNPLGLTKRALGAGRVVAAVGHVEAVEAAADI